MKRKIIIAALALLTLGNTAQAQVDHRQTVTVTNNDGKSEEIDLPEAMTQEMDSLLSVYNAKMYLRPDTGCHLPNFNPTFEREVYKARLAKLPTVIEMPYNDIVQKFIDRYSGQLRHSVAYMLGAQNFYMPIFEQALESYGLPLELKYLPVIESALNPTATSRVGATGLWQFMLATGKRYGLEVNSLVDERRDPVRASYAAAHYLSDLFKIYGDWNLVIAAYNCGPDKISKAMHRAKGQTDYWKIYPYLPAETRGYVPAFIAANYIMTYYCEHNICPMTTTLPIKTDTVQIHRDLHFQQVAQVLGVEVEQLRSLNPQYRRDVVNGASRPQPLRLPTRLVGTFIDQEDSIYATTVDNWTLKRQEVGVAQEAVRSTTSRRSNSRSTTRSSRSSKKKKQSRRSKQVTVRSGDTLSEIAERNGTTVSKLRRLNGIKGNNIRAGKKLKVK